MIQLEFSYRGGLAGKIVQAFTWSWCSHVDFVLPDNRLLGAVPDGGVSIREWTPADRIERYFVDAPDSVLFAAMDLIGKPYDWKAIIGIGLRQDWHDPDAWFCSECVEHCFEVADKPLIRSEHINRVWPNHLLMSPRLIPNKDFRC